MGVPAFFRWLTVRYPQVVVDALSEADFDYYHAEYKGQQSQNQNGDANGDGRFSNLDREDDAYIRIKKRIEENNPRVDSLYLDMNGIIHPCCHPIDKPQPKSEIEMFNLIFEYTDTVINIAKPSKLIYFAIDGVAPRAKMNQQRSRRFRTAIDTQEKLEREASIKNKWASEGINFTGRPTQNGDQVFDSNVITPGTEFMYSLSKALEIYIVERLHQSSQWKHLKVIFSDASVPGEGEHKILDFIRSQRAQEQYNPNTSHCIYGADADLIMLGLSTHELHFYILRESVENDRANDRGGKVQRGGRGQHSEYHKKVREELAKDDSVKKSGGVRFQFIKLPVVREYLYLEFKNIELPYALDFERVVDDFVFLCFFVGNDFLPHLPSLAIREGALDAIIFIYKNLLPSLGDYLTNGKGQLNRTQVDVLLKDLASVEEAFFEQHQKNAKFNEERRKRDQERDQFQQQQKKLQEQRQAEEQSVNLNGELNGNIEPVKWRNEDKRNQSLGLQLQSQLQGVEGRGVNREVDEKLMTAEELEEHNKNLIKNQIMQQADLTEDEKMKVAAAKLKGIVEKQIREKQEKQVNEYVDKIELGKEGWKKRYYSEKFGVKSEEEMKELRRAIKQAYIEGLEWVFSYYYNGCVSWSWYYPYHYAPFASDLLGCDELTIKFEKGDPACPFEQLLAVFPKQSAHALPECYRQLYAPDSEIIDFYPSEVKLDINGARYAWMGVNLLTFIDVGRLKTAMSRADQSGKRLSANEKERNRRSGDIKLFFTASGKNQSSKLQKTLLELMNGRDVQSNDVELQASFADQDNFSGKVIVPKIHSSHSTLFGQPLTKSCGNIELDIVDCKCFCVRYQHADYTEHLTCLLKDAVMPGREVEDFQIFHTNRRFFQGEEAIKIAENVLNIDSSKDPIYQFGGRTNRNGQEYGAYRNNHAVYGQEGGLPAIGSNYPHVGQRRTYQQYSNQAGYGQEQDQGQICNELTLKYNLKIHNRVPIVGNQQSQNNDEVQIAQSSAADDNKKNDRIASLLEKYNQACQNPANVLVSASLAQTQNLASQFNPFELQASSKNQQQLYVQPSNNNYQYDQYGNTNYQSPFQRSHYQNYQTDSDSRGGFHNRGNHHQQRGGQNQNYQGREGNNSSQNQQNYQGNRRGRGRGYGGQ